MKLPIKREFFDAISRGHKNIEWRDAHITFVCDETGRKIIKYIKKVEIIEFNDLPASVKELSRKEKLSLFDGIELIRFEFK